MLSLVNKADHDTSIDSTPHRTSAGMSHMNLHQMVATPSTPMSMRSQVTPQSNNQTPARGRIPCTPSTPNVGLQFSKFNNNNMPATPQLGHHTGNLHSRFSESAQNSPYVGTINTPTTPAGQSRLRTNTANSTPRTNSFVQQSPHRAATDIANTGNIINRKCALGVPQPSPQSASNIQRQHISTNYSSTNAVMQNKSSQPMNSTPGRKFSFKQKTPPSVSINQTMPSEPGNNISVHNGLKVQSMDNRCMSSDVVPDRSSIKPPAVKASNVRMGKMSCIELEDPWQDGEYKFITSS